MKNIKISDLANEIALELESYSEETTESFKEEVKNVVKESVKLLKQKSPKKAGDYAKGWKSKVVYEDNEDIRVKIYNSKKPFLTQLLENGHLLTTKTGKILGRVNAIPHIAPVRDEAEKMLHQNIKTSIRK